LEKKAKVKRLLPVRCFPIRNFPSLDVNYKPKYKWTDDPVNPRHQGHMGRVTTKEKGRS